MNGVVGNVGDIILSCVSCKNTLVQVILQGIYLFFKEHKERDHVYMI